jgi:hypothetical protein
VASDAQTLVTSADQILGLDVDSRGGFIYRIDDEQRTIQRSDLNGNGITTLLHLPLNDTGQFLNGGGFRNLRLDLASSHIYWTQDLRCSTV